MAEEPTVKALGPLDEELGRPNSERETTFTELEQDRYLSFRCISKEELLNPRKYWAFTPALAALWGLLDKKKISEIWEGQVAEILYCDLADVWFSSLPAVIGSESTRWGTTLWAVPVELRKQLTESLVSCTGFCMANKLLIKYAVQEFFFTPPGGTEIEFSAICPLTGTYQLAFVGEAVRELKPARGAPMEKLSLLQRRCFDKEKTRAEVFTFISEYA